jgi:hypothetical protein
MSLRARNRRLASLASLASIAALAAPAALLLVACGGKVDGTSFQSCGATEFCDDTGTPGDDAADTGEHADTADTTDTADDTSVDTGADAQPDVPFTCGKGPCVAGTACSIDPCTQAYCLSDGSWSYSDSCPPDAGGCPPSLPSTGTGCSNEGLSCTYPTTCGSAYAGCKGGVWYASTPTCPPPPMCPISEPAPGTPCDPALGKSCSWSNACGSVDYGSCDPTTARWQIAATCSGGCPATEPTAGSTCASTATCNYVNSCGGTDTARCTGGRWLFSIGPCTTPSCPLAVPLLGDACGTVGQACYWSCDKAYCSSTGWIPTNNTCGGCPGVEPANGSTCAPSGLSCGWANKCGGSDLGTCNSGRWSITGGTCSVPYCPATRPSVGSTCTSGGLGCEYGNGCGGIDWYVCNGSSWQMKGPSPCAPGCPSAKPSTGTPCMAGSSSSCQYVTDPIAQCTSGCFCTDVGTWACSVPSCSGPLPPVPVDAGVSDGGVGASG